MSLLYVIEFPLETYAFPVMHEVPTDEIYQSTWVKNGKTIIIDLNVNAYRSREECVQCINHHCQFIMQVQMHEMKLMAARIERNLSNTLYDHPMKNTLLTFSSAVKDTVTDLMSEIE